MSAPIQSARNPWLVAALVVVGVLVGALGSQLLIVRNAAPSPPTTAAEITPSSTEIAALRRVLEELPARLRESTPRPELPVSDRAPVGAPRDDIERLTLAIERLSDQLAKQRFDEPGPATEHVRAVRSSAMGVGYPSIQMVGQILLDANDSEVEGEEEKVQTEVLNHHMLWTRDDVIAHYGVPSAVRVGDQSITLRYIGPENARRTSEVEFEVMQGFISSIYVDWEDKD